MKLDLFHRCVCEVCLIIQNKQITAISVHFFLKCIDTTSAFGGGFQFYSMNIQSFLMIIASTAGVFNIYICPPSGATKQVKNSA